MFVCLCSDFAAKCLLLKQEWRRQLDVIAFVQYVIGGPTFWVRAALTFTRALEPMVLHSRRRGIISHSSARPAAHAQQVMHAELDASLSLSSYYKFHQHHLTTHACVRKLSGAWWCWEVIHTARETHLVIPRSSHLLAQFKFLLSDFCFTLLLVTSCNTLCNNNAVISFGSW